METSELLELEKQFWDAMKRKDGAAAERLTAEDASWSAHKASQPLIGQ